MPFWIPAWNNNSSKVGPITVRDKIKGTANPVFNVSVNTSGLVLTKTENIVNNWRIKQNTPAPNDKIRFFDLIFLKNPIYYLAIYKHTIP